MSTTTTVTTDVSYEDAGPDLGFTTSAARSNADPLHGKGESKPAPVSTKWNVDSNGRFALFPWDVSTLLIPQNVGAATTSRSLQKSTKQKYLALLAIGVSSFFLSSSPKIRTAGLSLLFPGAGFIAVGGIGGLLGFIVAVAFIPVALFAWFGAGGLAFPLADWIISGLVATGLAGPQVTESAAMIGLGMVAVVWTYLATRTEYEEQAEISKKDRRNEYLQKADHEWLANSNAAERPGSRELTLEQLRFAQRIVDLAMKDFDDWEGMTVIDQFQTSALRYQLYEFVYGLAVWNTIYAPSFRGYLGAAMRNAIDKSCTTKVTNYWKWESLWGNFTTVSRYLCILQYPCAC
jgi:hypothetical protein